MGLFPGTFSSIQYMVGIEPPKKGLMLVQSMRTGTEGVKVKILGSPLTRYSRSGTFQFRGSVFRIRNILLFVLKITVNEIL